jgi:hypothetical protein
MKKLRVVTVNIGLDLVSYFSSREFHVANRQALDLNFSPD